LKGQGNQEHLTKFLPLLNKATIPPLKGNEAVKISLFGEGIFECGMAVELSKVKTEEEKKKEEERRETKRSERKEKEENEGSGDSSENEIISISDLDKIFLKKVSVVNETYACAEVNASILSLHPNWAVTILLASSPTPNARSNTVPLQINKDHSHFLHHHVLVEGEGEEWEEYRLTIKKEKKKKMALWAVTFSLSGLIVVGIVIIGVMRRRVKRRSVTPWAQMEESRKKLLEQEKKKRAEKVRSGELFDPDSDLTPLSHSR
jgi:hypothetical protein